MSDIRTRTVEANGLSFTIDEMGAGDDVALFLHGFPESRYSWRHQLPLLAEKGWRAVAPDLRGYGASSRPKGRAAYGIDHLVEDVAGLFDAVGAKGRRLLVGHDWGAIVAWAYAIEQRTPLDGLVVMNVPHPTAYVRVMRRGPAQWLKSWYIFFFQLPGLPELALRAGGARAIGRAFSSMAVDKSRFPDEVLDHYRHNALQPGAAGAMVNYYRANFGALGRFAQAPAKVEVPTLMIWGEVDAALGIELTEGYDDLVADFTLERLPNVSHWVQQEAPEAVNDRLAHWLKAKGL